jgi:hypothetical protein
MGTKRKACLEQASMECARLEQAQACVEWMELEQTHEAPSQPLEWMEQLGSSANE